MPGPWVNSHLTSSVIITSCGHCHKYHLIRGGHSLSTAPLVWILSPPDVRPVVMDLEHTRLWGNWERAAKLSNNTQTAVAVTGLKAALVIGEMWEIIGEMSCVPFIPFIRDINTYISLIWWSVSIGFISHDDQQDNGTNKEPEKQKPNHQSILKDSNLDAKGSQGVSKADIKKKRTIFKESRHLNMSFWIDFINFWSSGVERNFVIL